MLGRTKLSLPVCSLSSAPPCAGLVPWTRVDHAEVVDVAGDLREKFADPEAALAVLRELPRRGEQIARRGELDAGLGEGQRLAVIASEQWLGIERIDVRRPALHEQKDHPLGPRRENAAASARGG